MTDSKNRVGPIVSAAHLAEGAMPALSEMEFALNGAVSAYHRWMERCAAAAGNPDLTAMDVLVLHHVNHRGQEKTLADLCLILNIEDTHLVNYSVKKLAGAGLVVAGKRGKSKTARTTGEGEAACRRYHEIREALLVEAVAGLGVAAGDIEKLAGLLRSLTGQYDQAARAAASL